VFAALSLGLGAYLFARAQAATHLAFTERAQHVQAAVTARLLLPQELKRVERAAGTALCTGTVSGFAVIFGAAKSAPDPVTD
jgi:hypothetical protein